MAIRRRKPNGTNKPRPVQMASAVEVPTRAPTAAAKPRLNLKEVGASGSVISAGLLLQQDYNVDLQTPQLYYTIDKMRKGDGQVASALRVIKLPLLSVDWKLEAPSDDPTDIQITEWLSDKLFNKMTITWHNLLRQSLLMLDYGVMPFEKVWEIDPAEKMVVLRKLAPRMPVTITQWKVDDTGGLSGVQQSAWRGQGYETVDIPVEKLLVFVNDLEGSDYKGQSVLRPAYKHWYFKDKLYIIDAIAKERRTVGIDVGSLEGNDVDDDDRIELENALMTLHAHEKAFMIEQKGRYTYRVEGVDGNLLSAMDSIEHHDLRILRSVLAEFLAMGAGSTGSLAMHQDKSSFFVMALESVATNICDDFNRYLIPQWCDFNWKMPNGYPKLIHGRLDTRDVGMIAEAVSKFVTSGTLTAGPDIEEQVRDILGLPEMPDEVANPPEPEPQPEDDLPDEAIPDDFPPELASLLKRNYKNRHARRHTAREFSKSINFADINQSMDDGESRIIKMVKAAQEKQTKKLAEVAVGLLLKNDLKALGEITVPYKTELANQIKDVLQDLFDEGRNQVQKELKMSLEPGSQEAKTFLFMRAMASVNVLADRLKSSTVWQALEMYRDEDINASNRGFLENVLYAYLKSLSEREIKKTAQNTVSEALNLGRDSAARGGSFEAVYSSVLDRGTCQFCESADGIRVQVGSEDYERLKPPYKECLGHGKCRCVFIYIGKED